MPDQIDLVPGLSPQTALRDLPLLSPPRSGWPAMQATLDARARHARPRWHWLAAAAVLAFAALLPRWIAAPLDPAPAPSPGAATTTSSIELPNERAALHTLMAESAQLETLIAWSRSEPVASAAAASLTAAVQDRIELVDALLARVDADPDAALPLWQERVVRLRELAGLQTTQQLLAANGDADQGMPVLMF